MSELHVSNLSPSLFIFLSFLLSFFPFLTLSFSLSPSIFQVPLGPTERSTSVRGLTLSDLHVSNLSPSLFIFLSFLLSFFPFLTLSLSLFYISSSTELYSTETCSVIGLTVSELHVSNLSSSPFFCLFSLFSFCIISSTGFYSTRKCSVRGHI